MINPKYQNISAIPKELLEDPLHYSPDQPGIIEVYADNFLSEIKKIGNLLKDYPYIGMDTEFPGTVYCLNTYTADFYYQTLKLNVDKLKLIQLGITLSNKHGEMPKGIHTWQFNLSFDTEKDKYSNSSYSWLVNCGIDFEKLKRHGIPHDSFAEYFVVSGLVLNPNVYWVSYHGSYDFGYWLKLLLNKTLPKNVFDFTNDLSLYFPVHYDIRILVQGKDHLQGGWNRLANYLEIVREGKTHQAGSDSVVTIEVFFKLLQNMLIEPDCWSTDRNIIFGIGHGADDNETITYTRFSNGLTYTSTGYIISGLSTPGTSVNIPNQSNDHEFAIASAGSTHSNTLYMPTIGVMNTNANSINSNFNKMNNHFFSGALSSKESWIYGSNENELNWLPANASKGNNERSNVEILNKVLG